MLKSPRAARFATQEEIRAHAARLLKELDASFDKLRREPRDLQAEADRERLHAQWRADNEGGPRV
jgi:hypothetical protein